MQKAKRYFSCQACGYQTPKWLGRCPDCGEWNTMIEEIIDSPDLSGGVIIGGGSTGPLPITDVESGEGKRLSSGISEFDRVLGGGIVPGSLVLIGGDPGIGKSTLLLQSSGKISKKGKTVLYISGEESPGQIRMRSDRLGSLSDKLFILAETRLEDIVPRIDKLRPSLIIIDSVQTIYTMQIQSAPGSISQVREVSAGLMRLSKDLGIPTFLIGHVTKDGAIAGPRVLEHMVDTVLYFEGDRGHSFRILRAVKNRFGSTNEIGVFEMMRDGLAEVSNPSEIFLAERPSGVPGSVVVSSIEGTRPIMLELQSLVSASTSFGMPRRMTTGVDHNRVSILTAILEKRAGLHLQGEDIFVNIAGGIKINEPATDLGIVTAMASSFKNQPIDSQTIVIGEVGLGGEVRVVPQIDMRIGEGIKLGFTRCIIPKNRIKTGDYADSIDMVEVGTIGDAFEILFS